ncbi:MAG: MFS transporter [Aquificaceae bacterium]|nr:MFS transporter [Aquificaceae bacterium]
MFKDFTPQEKKIVNSITFAVAVRMLGLFLLLPVLSPYLKTLENATPQLIGIAIGIYGLAQATLQIPFGYLSDRYGRKPVIIAGMITYIVGSVMAGVVSSMWSMIFARFLQGFGAVSSAITALTADLVREEIRARAFAQIGASIALTFLLSMVVAPLLAGSLGVPFLFFLTAFLSLITIVLLILTVPEPEVREREISPSLYNLFKLMADKNQTFLNISVGLLHALLVVVFTLVPYKLVYDIGLPKLQHWKVYIPAVLVSLLMTFFLIFLAERKRRFKEVFMLGVLALGLSFVSFEGANGLTAVSLGILLFFLGFMILEALIPSLLTRLTHKDLRGISFGLFNTVQFLGAFVGGIWGGYALKHGQQLMTYTALILCLVWVFVSLLWFKTLKLSK